VKLDIIQLQYSVRRAFKFTSLWAAV